VTRSFMVKKITPANEVHDKITILGAYGCVNIGDELILHAILKVIGTHPSIVVVGRPVRSDEVRNVQNHYSNIGVTFIPSNHFLKCIRSTIKSRLFIGGGQIIDGGWGLKLPFFQLAIAIITKLSGGSVHIGGVGAVNVDTTLVRWIYRQLFNVADTISLRDKDSSNLLSFTGSAISQKWRILTDIAFSITNLIRPLPPLAERQFIVFAVHRAPHVCYTDSQLAKAFLSKLKRIVPDQYTILIVAHDSREEFDRGLVRELSDQFYDNNMNYLEFNSIKKMFDYL